MVTSMTLVGSQPEVIIPLNPEDSENGLSNPDSEQRRPSLKRSGQREKNVDRCGWNRIKTHLIYISIIVVLAISLISVIAPCSTKQSQPTPTSVSLPTASCPQGWIRNGERCYIFSNSEATWNESLHNCTSSDGSLSIMAAPQEMAFINKKKAPTEYWIGLRREEKELPWKLPNGSVFYDQSFVKGDGLCASLNDNVVSSTSCDSHRCWICYKDLPYDGRN